jgi:mannose-6-phosphate isomerase
MKPYPLTFNPIYKEKIWGGRNLQRLFGRDLPVQAPIGESWELADLAEGVSTVANGPAAGRTLTDLTEQWGEQLLGPARPTDEGRFPLLLKLLDANDTLSLQVHPDSQAVKQIPGAALKTECWYVLESRDGAIYKGVKPGVTAERFRQAIEQDDVDQYVEKIACRDGDFYYLPAGTVHAIGAGLVVAEIQTPSDTTYRVTDWGRGREIHVDRSMQCIHFHPDDPNIPGQRGERLLETPYFEVYLREGRPGEHGFAAGCCRAWMILGGSGEIRGEFETVPFRAGDTILVPADCSGDVVIAEGGQCLETILPEATN